MSISSKMDFDSILEEIGEFGRYQQKNYLLICLPVMFAAANSLSYVFTAGNPKYRCLIPECDNLISPKYNEPWIQFAIPGEFDSYSVFNPAQCKKYRSNYVNNSRSECPVDIFTTEEIPCSNWIYDDNDRTIVQDWKITCPENMWKLAVVGTVHFIGLVIGSALFGVLADKFGRKLIFIFCILFMSLTGILQGIAWNYTSFLIFALLNAIGTAGVYPLAFIIGVEMVGPNMREMSGVVLNYFYAIGEACVGLLAWLSGDWQILQFSLSIPPILFVIYYWMVPESIRWLLANHDEKRASKIIQKAAKMNGKNLSDTLIASFEKKSNLDNPNIGQYIRNDNIKNNRVKSEIYKTFKQAIKSKILLSRYIILLYIWVTNAFVFYGLSLNSTNLSGNKYLNFSLVCLIEIPGYTLAWISLKNFGRRWSLSGSLLLCSFTCAAGAFVPQDIPWAIVTLFLIGKLGVTSSFAVIYVYTAETMPTIIRSGGVGTMSTVARFGAMLAPLVPLLSIYYKELPLTTFAVVSLFGGLLSFALPETFGKKLPDTVEEAEQIEELDSIKTSIDPI